MKRNNNICRGQQLIFALFLKYIFDINGKAANVYDEGHLIEGRNKTLNFSAGRRCQFLGIKASPTRVAAAAIADQEAYPARIRTHTKPAELTKNSVCIYGGWRSRTRQR